MKKLLLTAIVFVGLLNTGQSQSLNFDGTNDLVSVGNVLPASYTKEGWVYLKSTATVSNLISGGSDGDHALYAPSGKLSAGHNGTYNYVSDASALTLNTWYHVALTYDAVTQTMKLYKNGILISTATSVPAYSGGNMIRLSSYGPGGGNGINGNMDEVRVWNVVRTANEIVDNMNCSLSGSIAGLVINYNFNQGTPGGNNTGVTTLNDISGNGNNGTLNNFALTGATSNWDTDVTLPTPPVAAISINSSVSSACSGSSVSFTATPTNGGTTPSFQWKKNSINAGSNSNTYSDNTLVSSDVISCILTSSILCANTPTSNTISINVTTTPTINISGTSAICSGSSTILTASGASTFTWSSNAASATTSTVSVSPGITDVYTVTGDNGGGCGTDVKTYTVTVTATPTVNITGTAAICSGNSTILTGSGATTYTWSANAASATTSTVSVSPNTTDTYTLTGDNGGGCATDVKTYTVNVTATPTVSITGNMNICSGTSTTLTASGATNYTWNPTGSHASSISGAPTSTVVFTLTGSDASGNCSATTTGTINVTPSPTVGITGVSTICSGNSTVLTASGATSYTWSANAGSATTSTVTVNPGSTDTYTVAGEDNGCTVVKTVTVTVNNLPPVTITGTTTICNGASTTLTGNGADTYVWTSGPSTAANNISPTSNTTYTVTGTTTATGCSTIAMQLVTVNNIPVVTTPGSASNPTACSATDGSVTGFVVTGTPTLQYSWNGGTNQTSADITNIGAGPYSLLITDGNGCTLNGGTFTLSDPGAPAAPTFTVSSNSICEGGTITLTINSPNGSAIYSWTGPSGSVGTGTVVTINNTTVANDNGSYTAQISLSGCSSSSTPQTITVNALPVVTVNNYTICAGGTATLTATGASTYSWSTTEATASISPTPTITANYTVTGTDANNCSNSSTATVTVNNLPIVTFDMSPNMYCLTDPSVTLSATPASGTFSGTGVSSNQFNPSTAGVGTYTLSYTYTDGNSCSNNDTAVVDVQLCGSGINHFTNNTVNIYPNPATDVLNIQTSVLSENSVLEIYNNLGQKVSSTLLKDNSTQLSISGLNSGIYEARIINNNAVVRQIKIVKQ